MRNNLQMLTKVILLTVLLVSMLLMSCTGSNDNDTGNPTDELQPQKVSEEEPFAPVIDTLDGEVDLADRWKDDTGAEFRVGSVRMADGNSRTFLQKSKPEDQVVWRHVLPYNCQEGENGPVTPKAIMADDTSVIMVCSLFDDTNQTSMIYLGIYNVETGEPLGTAILPEESLKERKSKSANKLYNIGYKEADDMIFVAYEDLTSDDEMGLKVVPVIMKLSMSSVLGHDMLNVLEVGGYDSKQFLMDDMGLPIQMIHLETLGHLYLAYSETSKSREIIEYDYDTDTSKFKKKVTISKLFSDDEYLPRLLSIDKTVNGGYIWTGEYWGEHLYGFLYNKDGVRLDKGPIELIGHHENYDDLKVATNSSNHMMAVYFDWRSIVFEGFYEDRNNQYDFIVKAFQTDKKIQELHVLMNEVGSVELLVEYYDDDELKSHLFVFERDQFESEKELLEGGYFNG